MLYIISLYLNYMLKHGIRFRTFILMNTCMETHIGLVLSAGGGRCFDTLLIHVLSSYYFILGFQCDCTCLSVFISQTLLAEVRVPRNKGLCWRTHTKGWADQPAPGRPQLCSLPQM